MIVVRMAGRFVPSASKTKGDGCGCLTRRSAIAARRRRLDNDRLVRVDNRFVAPLQTLHAPVLAAHPILANLTSLAAGQSKWAYPSMARQDRTFHLLQETDRPANSAAGVPFAAPARAGPDVEIFEHDRVAEFQNLRIGQ